MVRSVMIFSIRPKVYTRQMGKTFGQALQKAWHGEETSNDTLVILQSLNQNYTRVSSFFVEDGSYMRCKLLQVGYTIPRSG